MGLFSSVGDKTVQDAQAAIREDLQRIDPLLTKVFMMARALIHGALNRIKCKIEFEILPDSGENPPTDENDPPTPVLR